MLQSLRSLEMTRSQRLKMTDDVTRQSIVGQRSKDISNFTAHAATYSTACKCSRVTRRRTLKQRSQGMNLSDLLGVATESSKASLADLLLSPIACPGYLPHFASSRLDYKDNPQDKH